jgi:hypothetical protein
MGVAMLLAAVVLVVVVVVFAPRLSSARRDLRPHRRPGACCCADECTYLGPAPRHGVRSTGPAKYLVTWNFNWNGAVPAGAEAPGFSPPVGAAHEPDDAFWVGGEPADEDVRAVAELGDATALIARLNAEGKTVFDSAAVGPGGVSTTAVNVGPGKHLTVMSMVVPSPDWFVGVSNVNLGGDGTWVPYAEYALEPYDAGTDAGTTLDAADAPQTPRGVIRKMSDDEAMDLFGNTTLGFVSFTLIGGA